MTLAKCPNCLGAKKIMGAGMIYHDCKNCGAIGYVEFKQEQKRERKNVNAKNSKTQTDELRVD